MTHLPIVFHPAVEDDLAAIYGYYEQFDPVLPNRFGARLDEQVERLAMFPESGLVLFESYRRVLIKRFPYMAIYRVGEERVDVLAVIGVQRAPETIEATVSERGEA